MTDPIERNTDRVRVAVARWWHALTPGQKAAWRWWIRKAVQLKEQR